ncbi:MAG: DUF4390 domain-containing protein [Magnetococcales bacterium]|nr:DUF4390 domain-containing protein [Magnetococcales bacterium]
MITMLIAGCGRHSQSTNHTVIQQTVLLLQGEKLLAHSELAPPFLLQLGEQLAQGEPLLASYRFRIRRLHPWLPDTRILDKPLQRHIRKRLITERYELREEQQRLVHYTTDEQEALNFIGNPRFILLANRFKPLPQTRYQMETHLSITPSGMSRLFLLLNRWLSLGKPMEFIQITELP